MSFQMGSSLAFGIRKRTHPLAIFGLTTLGSLALICSGGLFLTQSVTEGVAAAVATPRTAPPSWYVPSSGRTSVAEDLDIARELPVELSTPGAMADVSAASRIVRVEALRVRARPSKANAQLFTLKGGTTVSVGAREGEWVEISARDGRKGWVHASLLLEPRP